MPSKTQPTIEALYEQHFDFVWSNLRRLGVPMGQLEDAAHDVFSVVHRRRDSWDGRCRIETWLFGIVRRIASHHRRREARHRRRVEAFARHASPPPAAETSLAQRDALRRVESFLAELDPSKREVFMLAHIEQMTGREIAEALSINPNTASARLRAARAELRRFADEHELGDALVDAREDQAPEDSRRRVLAALVPVFALPRGESRTAARSGGIKLALVVAGVGAILLGAAASNAGARQSGPVPAVVTPREYDPAPEPAPPVVEMPAAPTTEPADPVVVEMPEAPPEPAMKARPRPSPPKQPKQSKQDPVSPNLDDLDEQTRLAKRVSKAPGPAEVLRRIAEYERRFPAGFFSERLAFEGLSARCALGQIDEARREVSELRRRYPGSTLLPRDPKHPCGITKPVDGGDEGH